MTEQVEDILDEIVLAVLILEHRLRETAKTAALKAVSVGGVGNLPAVPQHRVGTP